MAIPVGTILLPSFLLLLPCLPPTRVCGGRPPPEQTFFGRRGWVHRSVRLSCRWKAEQVSPTFPRGATRRALAPSATYPCCGCRWLGPRNLQGAVCVMSGRPSQGASAVLKGAPLAPWRFLHANSCLVASNCIEGVVPTNYPATTAPHATKARTPETSTRAGSCETASTSADIAPRLMSNAAASAIRDGPIRPAIVFEFAMDCLPARCRCGSSTDKKHSPRRTSE